MIIITVFAKIERRPIKPVFEINPETNNLRKINFIDFYAIDNEQYLSCIDFILYIQHLLHLLKQTVEII